MWWPAMLKLSARTGPLSRRSISSEDLLMNIDGIVFTSRRCALIGESSGWGRGRWSTTCSLCQWRCQSRGCCSCCRSCQHPPSPLCQSSCGRTRWFWWRRPWLGSRKVLGLRPSPSSKPTAHRLTICSPEEKQTDCTSLLHLSFILGSWWAYFNVQTHKSQKGIKRVMYAVYECSKTELQNVLKILYRLIRFH